MIAPKYSLVSKWPLLSLALLLWVCEYGNAQDRSQAQGFSAFRTVLSRNIFDPERRAVRPQSSRSSMPPPVVRGSGAVTLTGTMVTPDRSLAFFGSLRAEYNKVLAPQEMLGEFKVVSIQPHAVTLEKSGETTVINVGNPLPSFGRESAAPASAVQTGTEPAPPVTDTPPSADGNDRESILRRLKERREKENAR